MDPVIEKRARDYLTRQKQQLELRLEKKIRDIVDFREC